MGRSGHTMGRGPFPGAFHEDPRFKKFIILSVFIHLLLLAVAGSLTLFHFSGQRYSPTYTVDLVTVPGPPAAARRTARVPEPAKKPPVRKAEPKPVRKTAEPPVALPRDNKAEPVPYEGDEAARSDRREKIRELEEKARKLFEQFSVEETAAPPAAETGEGAATGTAVESGTGADSGGGAGEPSDLLYKAYYNRIYAHIYAVWNPPESVTRDSKIMTVVGIRIAPGGNIEEQRIEKSSGNIYYDESVVRAVRAADPLPPIPVELGNSPLEVGLNFLPSGK